MAATRIPRMLPARCPNKTAKRLAKTLEAAKAANASATQQSLITQYTAEGSSSSSSSAHVMGNSSGASSPGPGSTGQFGSSPTQHVSLLRRLLAKQEAMEAKEAEREKQERERVQAQEQELTSRKCLRLRSPHQHLPSVRRGKPGLACTGVLYSTRHARR